MKGVQYDPNEEEARQTPRRHKSSSVGRWGVVDFGRELGIKDSALRCWAQEYEEMEGCRLSLGNGSPEINEDYEIVKLHKRVEELEHESGLLSFRVFLSIAMCEARAPESA